MTDDLDALRATRSSVDPPSHAARRAARARWEHAALELATAGPVQSSGGVRQFTMRTAIAGVLATALVAGVWFVTRARIDSVKPKHVLAVTPLPQTGATEPQVFLLIGSDSRAFVRDASEKESFGDPNTNGGARSDTIVLVRLDPTTRDVLVVSIPRDLFVELPGCGRQKINAAFNSDFLCGTHRGGAQLLVDTITKDLGVPINHVIQVQFPQFASLVDELGGLRINFPVPARDAYTGLAVPSGCALLNGDQALAFVRSRFFELLDGEWRVDPTADLGRMQRQQLALRQLAVAARARLSTDPRPLMRALFENVSVDPGFTSEDALRYFAALRGEDPTAAMNLPTKAVSSGEQSGLALDPAAQPVLDALAGRGTPAGVANSPDSASGPTAGTGQSGRNDQPTAC